MKKKLLKRASIVIIAAVLGGGLVVGDSNLPQPTGKESVRTTLTI